MKKIFAVLLALSLAVCAGCAGSGSSGASGEGKRDVTLKMSYYAGGYGDAWIKAVVKDYMSVNNKVGIELTPSYDNTTAVADITSGSASCDIYQIEMSMFGNSEYLLELSDLYNAKAYDEDTLVKDKISEEIYNFYSEGGKYYQMPNTNMTGWNWIYNKTVLDELYGEGKYTIPRTTDEMFSFGDDLFNNKQTFLTLAALADTQGGEYTGYAFEMWFAQMLGKEGYTNFINGRYFDTASGTYKFSETSPMCLSVNKSIIEKTYAMIYKLCAKSNHYLYSDSDSLNFKGADQVFFGGGYGLNKAKVAMMYTGAWMETEVADLIADEIVTKQDVIAVKMPVISAITERCSTIKSDSVLAATVDYVDGNGEKPEGVSDEDIAIIKEARNFICENCCRSMVVPKNTKHPDEVKEFLSYLASDRAQKISAQNTSGLNMLPFGYTPTEEDMGFQFTPYVKSIYDKKPDSIVIDVSRLNNPFAEVTNMTWFYDKSTSGTAVAKTVFAGNATKPEEIYESTIKHYDTDQWKTFIENYHIKTGK